MKLSIAVRDLLELVALVFVVAAVAIALGLWPALLVAGAALGYLSHAWDFGAATLRLGRRDQK